MKKKMTMMFTAIVLMALSGFSSPSQEWFLLKDESGVKAYYQLGNCDARNVMFLKFENTLATDVKVDFLMMMERNLPTPQVISLKANEVIVGQCQGTPDLVKDVSSSSPDYHVTMKLIN